MSDHREGHITGAEGLRIVWQAWLPPDPTAVVVISHGVSEHSDRYAHVGDALVAAGIAVYAHDHRGHGNSEGDRALLDRMDNVVSDLRAIIELARSEQPGVPCFLLGHSMGGLIALEFALRHADEIDGLILSGPAVAVEAASPAQRAVASLLSKLTPKLGVFAVETDAISRDPEVVRAYEEDPLVHHRKIPARTVAEMASTMVTFPGRLPSLELPLLVMHGGEDSLIPRSASEMVDRHAGSADKTLKVYPELRHEILNEPERAEVIADIVAWVRGHGTRP